MKEIMDSRLRNIKLPLEVVMEEKKRASLITICVALQRFCCIQNFVEFSGLFAVK